MPKGPSSLEHGLILMPLQYTHVLEFGVFKGKTLRTTVARAPGKEVFGFASLVGLDEDWAATGGGLVGHPDKGVRYGHFSLQGQVPEIPGATIFPGWFRDTIPRYLRVAKPIALLHVDCDLYSSTRTALVGLNDFIRPGTILVFDEWIYNHDPRYDDHEQRAFKEWAKQCGRECELLLFQDRTKSGEERQIVRVLN